MAQKCAPIRGALREIARDFSRFGYDPTAGTVEFGPYTIEIDVAARAAVELARAIYLAAHEVDKASIAQLRAKTIEALTDAGIPHNPPNDVLRVSPGSDLRVWLSFRPDSDVEEQNLRTLAERIVSALAHAGLHLESTNQAEHLETAERLVRGDLLSVAKGTSEGGRACGWFCARRPRCRRCHGVRAQGSGLRHGG